jgi:hypothetical protein
MYIDHVPANVLNGFTLRNFGFSDAAELFVLLSGFAAMAAYGRNFERDGHGAGLRRIAMRCLRLYLFQVGLLLVTLLSYAIWVRYFQLIPRRLAPLLDGSLSHIVDALTLRSQPSNLNILPLYIVLMALFPLIYAGMRRHPWATLGLSAALWAAAFLNPEELNFVNALDGDVWYFNPFAWQFLFTIGAGLAVAMRYNNSELPRWRWLVWLCIGYLAFSLLQVFPWAGWGLPDLSVIPMPEAPDKTDLSPWRLLHVLALVYVTLTWPQLRAAIHRPVFAVLATLGRHSLEVFALGTALALLARLTIRNTGDGIPMQLAINLAGLGAMYLLAHALEKKPRPVPAHPVVA